MQISNVLSGHRFGFSRWALSLNDMPEGLERLLPPSDMRWRRDVRLLEQGKYDEAEGERKRLLKRVASAREAATRPFEPRWFQLHPEVRCADTRAGYPQRQYMNQERVQKMKGSASAKQAEGAALRTKFDAWIEK